MESVNWVGLLSVAVGILTFVCGGSIKFCFDVKREMAELRVGHEKLLNSIADKYVRSPEFAEFRALIRQELQAIRTDFVTSQTATQQDIKALAGLIHELKGAVSATNNPRG